ncbi:MAG: hypothetical protein OEM39_09180 [Acidimicrobiia bacterium]|nr:hypothetical protein [Acidimicrobiia bacterium]MDH3462242.1 hypothetical protein [Acidimicrobiia bacterium]
MAEIPESLLRRSAEAKAKALGVPVEDVLAEMRGDGPPVTPPQSEAPDQSAEAAPEEGTETEEVPEEIKAEAETTAEEAEPSPEVVVEEAPADLPAPTAEEVVPAAAVAVEDRPVEAPVPSNGSGNGKVAAMVSPRPTVPPAGTPEGVRTQRLLTVVKARAIQNVKAEPTDKVNTWPHLMLLEFGALLLITGVLIVMAVVIHSPLLDPANINATPNPSKAPWYFLGLQELLSYFDPQIAGVMVPTITGMIGFILIPFIDRNPSTRPSDRKFAIALYSIFLAGAATLTIIGVLFRGQGFNFSYPWKDGIFFDDLKDWVDFE